MAFFPLAISFWELANYNKWQTKIAKLLELLLERIKGELIPYKSKSPSIFFNPLQTPWFDVDTNKVCGSMRGLRFFCRGYVIFFIFCSFLAHKIKNK